MIKVYVAGPDVFRQDAKEYLEEVRAFMDVNGLKALIPLDNEVEGGFGVDLAAEIYKGNVAMIDECDVVMANLVPFRGPHMDCGTAFEVGYAKAKGKPVYGYTPHAYDTLVARILPRPEKPLADDRGMIVEDFGETENLMITIACDCIFPTLRETVLAIRANLGSSGTR